MEKPFSAIKGNPENSEAHHSFINYDLEPSTPLIEMSDVSVTYGETKALDNISWKVTQGENWLISGPNGAGKSTLLSLVTADNHKATTRTFTYLAANVALEKLYGI